MARRAVRRVRAQRGGARLAVLQHRGHRGAEVAVPLRVRDAAVLAGGKGPRDRGGVARRRVGRLPGSTIVRKSGKAPAVPKNSNCP
jgi:hypothetical protein